MNKTALARKTTSKTDPSPLRAPTKQELDKFKDRLTGIMQERAGVNVFVRLTRGCSNQCPFCSERSEPNPREHMPLKLAVAIYEALERVNEDLKHWICKTVHLYRDSDPLEYLHLLELRKMIIKSSIGGNITTSVPKGSEELFVFLMENSHEKLKLRLSLTAWNKARLMANQKIREMLEKNGIVSKKVVVKFLFVTGGISSTLANHLNEHDDNAYIPLQKKVVLLGQHNYNLPVLPIIGDERRGAFLFEANTSVDTDHLPVFTNLVSFSKAVTSGALKPGEPFVIEYLPQERNRVKIDELEIIIDSRDWNFGLVGRIASYSPFSKISDNEGYILIDNHGGIHITNLRGICGLIQLSPPVVE